MAPQQGDKIKKAARSSNLLDSINPWGSGRNTPPTAGASATEKAAAAAVAAGTTSLPTSSQSNNRPSSSSVPTIPAARTPDHSINSYYGRSLREYPPDCPPLNVQWFHAVDIPKRKALWLKNKKVAEDAKPQLPKKFVAFSASDNRSIESAYQKVLEGLHEDRLAILGSEAARARSSSQKSTASYGDLVDLPTEQQGSGGSRGRGVKVPVNEDFLFDVDIGERELAPVYWLGPVYEVRRGSWFYQEGSNLRSCEENLAAQLEEGYLKAKPWRYPAAPEKRASNSHSHSNSNSNSNSNSDSRKPPLDEPKTAPKAAVTAAAELASTGVLPKTKEQQQQQQYQPQTHRLFGHYMNHVVTYQDATTAWLSTDGMLSWVTSTIYERFSNNGYLGGIKVVRGYSEPKKAAKDEKRPTTPTGTKLTGTNEPEEKRLMALKRRSAPPSTSSLSDVGDTTGSGDDDKNNSNADTNEPSEIERRGRQLQRQLSSFMSSAESLTLEKEAEEVRRLEEKEIQNDYNAQSGETQGREIEHLILVTHGIGQLLGFRMESFNFIHDVNVLRKTLKSVYSASPNLRALNSELGDGPGNCRIQVLPVCWRHLLDFPRRSEPKKQERDLSDAMEEEDEYPSLEDITIDGMSFARSLISDLALDVLLYQSAYRQQIADIVLTEANRIYKLFLERNPSFKGSVHIIGHSLGSAIMFDILCRQREQIAARQQSDALRNPLRFWPSPDGAPTAAPKAARHSGDLSFDFDVADFYCLGSPIGLFQMLKGRTIAARHGESSLQRPDGDVFDFEYPDNGVAAHAFGHLSSAENDHVSPITGLPFSVSSPKVSQLFNIFHPSDPISYRLEPLISPAMSSLRPQALPYTKKGLFGSVAPQGLTNIGSKVGQSVSDLWSSFSAGIASSLLNRSLGLTQEDVAKLQQQQQQNQHLKGSAASSSNAGTTANATSAGTTSGSGPDVGGNGNDIPLTGTAPPVDEEVETLFSHFEKKRADMAVDGIEDKHRKSKEDVAKAQRMRKEESKVRALNRNGRVDYSIQESALDFNPINTIASHMSYWADEDVSHFVMTQLLSKRTQPENKNTT